MKLGGAHRHPSIECPVCGYAADAASSIDDHPHPPRDGDAGLCLACGSVLLWQLDDEGALGLRLPSLFEREQLVRDPELHVATAELLRARDRALARGDYWPTGPRAPRAAR